MVYTTNPLCPPWKDMCRDDSRCITPEQFCDGHPDCDDRSDEIPGINMTSSLCKGILSRSDCIQYILTLTVQNITHVKKHHCFLVHFCFREMVRGLDTGDGEQRSTYTYRY
jgi:hypothetical protein